MLDITLAALGGFLLGLGLTYIWHYHHGDAAEVARLTRVMEEQYQRFAEREAELVRVFSEAHQAIVVDLRKDD